MGKTYRNNGDSYDKKSIREGQGKKKPKPKKGKNSYEDEDEASFDPRKVDKDDETN